MTFNEGKQRLAKAMLRPVNPVSIMLLGLFTVIWGLWVGNPFWTVFDRAALYSFMNFAPEWAWGLFAVVCGMVIAYSAASKKIRSLVLGAKVGGTYWFVVSMMYFLGDWMNTGGITAMMLCTYSFFVYLNLKVNMQHVEHWDELFTH